jgi:hypothetical protein
MVRLGIFTNDPNIGQFPLEIIYLKEREAVHGYIRANQMRLKALVDDGTIDRGALESVFF